MTRNAVWSECVCVCVLYVGVFMMKGGGPCWLLGYTHPSVSAGSCFQCGAFYISAWKDLSCSKHLHYKDSKCLKSFVIKTRHPRDNHHASIYELSEYLTFKRVFFCNGQRLKPTNRQLKISLSDICGQEEKQRNHRTNARTHTRTPALFNAHIHTLNLSKARTDAHPLDRYRHCYISSTTIIRALIHNGREHGRGTDTERYCVKLLSFIIFSFFYHARLSLC